MELIVYEKVNFVKNKDDVHKTLVNYFPQNMLKGIVINEFGWKSIVADINDSLICNFPRDAEKYKNLQQERSVTGCLGSKLTIEMPNRLRVEQGEYPFFLHRKIKGDYLDGVSFAHLNSAEQTAFLDSISDFFVLFHSVQPTSLIENNIIHPYKILFDDQEEISRNLIPYFSADKQRDIKSILKLYQNELQNDTEQVFCYNDFHGYNIVVGKDKRLKGVFDFDKVAINNRILDLRKVTLNYGWETGLELVNMYNAKTDNKIDIEKFKLYTVATHLCEFSWMHEINPDILKNIKSVNFSRHVNSLYAEMLKLRGRE